MSVLRALNLAKSYKSRQILKDISLEVESGEVVGLLGPNGATLDLPPTHRHIRTFVLVAEFPRSVANPRELLPIHEQSQQPPSRRPCHADWAIC
jgi:ABC-type phosphonate transport system ATPase subunit